MGASGSSAYDASYPGDIDLQTAQKSGCILCFVPTGINLVEIPVGRRGEVRDARRKPHLDVTTHTPFQTSGGFSISEVHFPV